MRKYNLFILIIFSLLFLKNSFAKVNLATGQFYEITTDYKYSIGKKAHFPIRRTYNSDSQIIGLFGKGWCSTLDLKFNKIKNQVIKCSNPILSLIHI